MSRSHPRHALAPGRGKLVLTATAEILLITVRALAITIKILRIVAYRTVWVYSFYHERLRFLGANGFVEKLFYTKAGEVFDFYLTLQYEEYEEEGIA